MINEVNFMNFKGKNKEKESHKKEMDNEIEIVMGDVESRSRRHP